MQIALCQDMTHQAPVRQLRHQVVGLAKASVLLQVEDAPVKAYVALLQYRGQATRVQIDTRPNERSYTIGIL